jgi:hypothetical protein
MLDFPTPSRRGKKAMTSAGELPLQQLRACAMAAGEFDAAANSQPS